MVGMLDIPSADRKGPAGWLYEAGLSEAEVEAIAAEPDREAWVRMFQTACYGGTASARASRTAKVDKFDLVEREKVAQLLSAKDSTRRTVDELLKTAARRRRRSWACAFQLAHASLPTLRASEPPSPRSSR